MDRVKERKDFLGMVLVSILLGIILSIQFKTVNKTVGEGSLPTQRAQQLASDLKKAQSDRDAQSNRIDELEKQIQFYEKSESEKNIYAERVHSDTMKYRMLAGYVDLEGPGITLEISEPPSDMFDGYEIIEQLDLILQTISVLNAADAEAISINDQRYTSFTEIERAADRIEINGISTNSPITIKAIGDPKTLEAALSIKNGIIDVIRLVGGLNVQVKQENLIKIPKSRKLQEFKFAEPLEEQAS